MKFYKGCESLSFFISTYVVFFLHIIFVYFVDDKYSEELGEINTTLILHKRIFSFFFILAFICHLITSFSDPGSIVAEKYLEILECYNFIYKEINRIKNEYNKIKEMKERDSDESYYSDSSILRLPYMYS